MKTLKKSLALFFVFLGVNKLSALLEIANEQKLKPLKITLFICSYLCIIGFFGWLIINENLWYIASMGYGIGAVIICIELLLLGKSKAGRG
jgi:cyanate permease